MNNFFSSLGIPVAMPSRTYRKNLSVDAYTTQDFFVMKPVYCRELPPRAKMRMNIGMFTRTQPLVHPLYADVKIINRAFAVPLRTLVNNWYEFIDDTPMTSGSLAQRVPSFSNAALASALRTLSTSVTANVAYDFKLGNGYYRLTDVGRIFYDILLGLGYAVTFDESDETPLSALPLLAYQRIYNDYYIHPQWQYFSYVKPAMGAVITETQLLNIANTCCYTNYDKDYFTSAWLRPNSPSSAMMSSMTLTKVTNPEMSPTAFVGNNQLTNDGNPMIANASAGTQGTPITQESLTWLKRITDLVKRNNIVGSRVVDRYLAKFGIKPTSAQLDRSIYIGRSINNLKISDVTATTDATIGDRSQALGDLGGKALGYGQGSISYDSAEDFCYIIVLSVVVPHVGYYEGRNRHCQHLTRLDFFDPTFDGIAPQPIRQDEVKSDFTGASPRDTKPSTYSSSNVFGWTSRYAEYKTAPHDICSGAFRLASRNVGLDSWHLMRQIQSSDLILSPGFTRGMPTQYNRAFVQNTALGDYFTSVFHFDVMVTDHVKPLFDDYDFDGGDVRQFEIGGTQLT